MKLLELIKQRPSGSRPPYFTYLYALRDSGIINMAMEAHLALAKNYFYIETMDDWGNFSSRTEEARENPEQIEECKEIVQHWMKECEAGGKDNDPTFDQIDYEDQLETIPETGY